MTASPVTKSPKRRPSRARWLWLPVLAILGVAAWYFWPKIGASLSASSTALPKGGKKGGSGAVPVVAEVTPAALKELNLDEGDDVWLSFKATDVGIYPA